MEGVDHLYIDTNGVRLHAAVAGPDDGPLAILLHGFPEYWYGWRHQIAALAGAGMRVVAPDQRGYNSSTKPQGVSSYRLPELGGDVLGILEWFGRESAYLVGHDWGGVVAWWLASNHPEQVEKAVIMNVPHPGAMRNSLLTSPTQVARSSYIAFFQIPLLPEALLSAAGFRAMKGAMCRSSRPGTFSPAVLGQYEEAWARPGALTAMLNWYRAALRRPASTSAQMQVPVPVRILWGARDAFLGREMASASLAYCQDGQLVLFDEASHWLQHEIPDEVNAHLLDYLGGSGG